MNISSLMQQMAIGQSPPNQKTNPGQNGNAFAELSGALSSGNPTTAQSAFTNVKQLLASAGSIGGASSVKSDFDALSKAIGSSDLVSARQDFSQLKSDVLSALHGQTDRKAPGHSIQGLLGTARTFVGLRR